MAKSWRASVRARARGCCEYCHLPESLTVTPHEIDHIRSQKHGGRKTLRNLALACFYCNSYKGPNVAGFDPLTDQLEPLFNPRDQDWSEHFEWKGAELLGKSAIGRTTVEVLRINLAERVQHRERLLAAGLFPPKSPDEQG